MNSEETEQLAGRSRSRLPPFGRRYAKPPAAALLTGQVARELASTLKRLRLVRSSHLPWPWRATRRSSRRCGRAGSLLSQTGWSSVSSFRARLYQAWAVTSPSRQHAGSRFLAPPRRGCQDWGPHFDNGGAIAQMGFAGHHLYGLKYAVGTEQSIPLRGRREHRSSSFGRTICAATCYTAIFNFACSSDQYSMSKRSASLIGVKQP